MKPKLGGSKVSCDFQIKEIEAALQYSKRGGEVDRGGEGIE